MRGRYELAKDVVSFCNTSAGHIVIGLATQRDPAHQIDRVAQLELVAPEEGRSGELLGIIRSHIYPDVAGVSIKWFTSAEEPTLGLLAIAIPQQPSDRRPFVVHRVEEDGTPLRQIVVGYAERRGADNMPYDAKQLQQALRRGMDGVSQRLSRLEEKLDRLLIPQEAQGSNIDPSSVDATITARIEKLLDE